MKILFALFAIGVFVYAVGGRQIESALASMQRGYAEEKVRALVAERESAFAASYVPASDCAAPAGELKRLECRNRRDMASQAFAANWNARNASRFP